MSEIYEELLVDSLLIMEQKSAADSELRQSMARLRASVRGSEDEATAWEDVLLVAGHRNRLTKQDSKATPVTPSSGLTGNLSLRLSDKLRTRPPSAEEDSGERKG